MHQEFMAFVTDAGSYDAVRDAAQARGYPSAVVQQGGMELLGDMLEKYAPPKVLLLDLDGQGDVLVAAQRAVSLCGPDTKLILAASKNDVSLYRQFLQMGVADYLVKPLFKDVVQQAIHNAARSSAAPEAGSASEARTGKIIPVIGVRGGVGATLVASNLAWIMAHKLELYANLMDLDVHFGAAALALDQEPGRGLRAALENPERLDGLLIASSMTQESEKLSLLCTEEDIGAPMGMDGETVLSLIRPVSKDFDAIVLDMPRAILHEQKRLIAEAHAVVLVADMSLVSLRDARRIRAFLKNLRPDLLPIVVVNHAGESSASMIDQPTFEKNLEAPCDFVLAEDIKLVRQASAAGKALAEIAPESAISKTLLALARLVAGLPAEHTKAAQGGSSLKNLLGGLVSKAAPKASPAKEQAVMHPSLNPALNPKPSAT